MNHSIFTTKNAVLILAVLAVIAFAVLSANPGCEPVVVQPDVPVAPIVPPAKPLDVFRQDWNSEDPAEWPVATPLAEMSNSAYLDVVAAAPAMKRFGFSVIQPIVVGSMAVYVVSGEDVVVVVFRGTDERADWLVNLDRTTIQTEEGPIHRGFFNAYGTLRDKIAGAVTAAKAKHVWVTGHSLGGALAVVCAADLIENDIEIRGVITFGQPMVARRELVRYLDTLLLRRLAHYVNEADVVPRLSPEYSHCGSLVWFTEGTIMRSKPKFLYQSTGKPSADEPKAGDIAPMTEAEFQALQAEVLAADPQPEEAPDGKMRYRAVTPWIADHSMEKYLEKIKGIGSTETVP